MAKEKVVKVKEKENKLEKFKKEYWALSKKHNLPPFEVLNNAFDIEELASKQSERPLRLIRRRIADKTGSFMRFIEIFLNPTQAPLFYMMLAKNMPEEGRKAINEAYFELGRIEIMHIRLETLDSEDEEAKAIKEVTKSWPIIRESLKVLSEIFDMHWKKKSESKDKTYFG